MLNRSDSPVLRPRLVFAVTARRTAETFLLPMMEYVATEGGFDVTVIADSEPPDLDRTAPHVAFVAVPMQRDPSPISDFVSFVRILKALRHLNPHVVAYATPKASLLTSVSAFLLRVPCRVNQLWGIRFETVRGPRRLALRSLERLVAACSTAIVANSRSLAARAAELGIANRGRIDVLGEGSSHGVDLVRFAPGAPMPNLDRRTQEFLERNPGLTVGYVGRLHPDKGIDTLLSALVDCAGRGVIVRGLLVGGDEGFRAGNVPPSSSIHMVGHVSDPRPYLARMDLLVLMSLREGFPNVVLEAASMGIPAVVADSTGTKDSVVDGITGLIVRKGDVDGLTLALCRLAADRELLRSMGVAARERAQAEFDQYKVWGLQSGYFAHQHSRVRAR